MTIRQHRGAAIAALVLGLTSCGGGEVEAGDEPQPTEGGFLRPAAVQERPEEPAESAVPITSEAPVVEAPTEVAEADPTAPIEASLPAQPPDPRPVLEAAARSSIEARDWKSAAEAISELLLIEVNSPEDADREALRRWSSELAKVQAQHRWSPRGDWPSFEETVRGGDSLIAIRKRALSERPSLLLCTGLIAKANQLRSETAIRPDDVLRIPTDEAWVLVDLSARWAFYCLGDEVAAAWEVGIGKEDHETPPGTYEVGLKKKEPSWFPEGREMVPFGDPENPLGTRWMAWHVGDRSTSLGFHGTNEEAGVGGRVSRGCVRMRNEDVEMLYDVLPLHARVVVQP